MAIALIERISLGNSKSAGTSWVKSTGNLATGFSIGDLLVVILGRDDATSDSSSPTDTLTDDKGNTYTKAVALSGISNSANAAAFIYYCNAAQNVSAGTAVTLTWTFQGGASITAKAGSFHSFSGAATSSPLDTTNTATGSGTTPAITLTPGGTDYLIVGCWAVESDSTNTYTGDSDTTAGSWSTLSAPGTTGGGNASNLTTPTQHKITTGNNAQSWNPTTGTSADWKAVIASFKSATASTPKSDGDTASGVDANGNIAFSHSDTGAGTEAGTLAATVAGGDDAASGTETAGSIAFSHADTASGADAEARIALAGDDPGTAADDGSINATLTDADTGSQAETVTSIALTDVDTASGVDAEASIAVPFSDSDSGTAVDANGTIALSHSESASGADAGESLAATTTADDTGSGADTNGSIAASHADTATAVDAEAQIALAGDDPATTSDNGSINATLTGADTASASESESIDSGGAPSSTDSGSATEDGTIAATLTDSDTATATESQSITVVGEETVTVTQVVGSRYPITEHDQAEALYRARLRREEEEILLLV